ncbi:unnamed protein product [Thelazia callipaeda]|uniref:Uncharacterized protein n=1 Tax=Thelazia callipaeda TaxID=103827 RepID=A0A0N5CKH5_THECL|nr:unnamed protein product [Thelazia callipaeda]
MKLIRDFRNKGIDKNVNRKSTVKCGKNQPSNFFFIELVARIEVCLRIISNLLYSANSCDKMPYIDSITIFKTLFGPLIGETETTSRRRGWDDNDGWPGSGGPGGPSRNQRYGGRRPIGRPAFSSGMSCPPMSGGG